MRTVIGLAGVKTSGKSTAADMVKELIGGDISESALAGKLKDVCADVFGLTRDHFDFQEIKEVPFEDGPMILTADNIFDILASFNVGMELGEFVNKYSKVIGTELETPRRIAQIVGTEILRATGDEDIHCKNMPMNEDGITIVSDLRFPNEFAYFSEAEDINFLPLYIQRDEAEAFVTEDSHPSEKCVFEFSEKCNKISNNSSLEDLKMILSATLETKGFLKEESIWA
tara:strand:- start:9279 stop:9962 length:684 start_codon:yes stop_codon:yes gene_type:complete